MLLFVSGLPLAFFRGYRLMVRQSVVNRLDAGSTPVTLVLPPPLRLPTLGCGWGSGSEYIVQWLGLHTTNVSI